MADGTARVILVGEIDIYSAPDVQRVLRKALMTGMTSVVIDVALVSFCDAAGLGLLVRANNELTARGGEMSLVKVPARLRRLLMIADLAHLLRVPAGLKAGNPVEVDLVRPRAVPDPRTPALT